MRPRLPQSVSLRLAAIVALCFCALSASAQTLNISIRPDRRFPIGTCPLPYSTAVDGHTFVAGASSATLRFSRTINGARQYLDRIAIVRRSAFDIFKNVTQTGCYANNTGFYPPPIPTPSFHPATAGMSPDDVPFVDEFDGSTTSQWTLQNATIEGGWLKLGPTSTPTYPPEQSVATRTISGLRQGEAYVVYIDWDVGTFDPTNNPASLGISISQDLPAPGVCASAHRDARDVALTTGTTISGSPSTARATTSYGVAFTQTVGGRDRVVLRTVNDFGIPLGSVWDVSAGNSGNASNPSIVWADDFVIAWGDSRYGANELLLRLMSSSGAPVSPELRATTTGVGVVRTAMATSPTELGIAWSTAGTPNAAAGIWFTRVNRAYPYTTVEPSIKLSSGAGDNPSIVWTGVNWAVAWDEQPVPGNDEIFLARVDAAGAAIGTPTRITNDGAASKAPSLAWDGTQYRLVWDDALVAGVPRIFTAKVDSDGVKQGSDLQVSTGSAASTNGRIVWTGAEFGVVWEDRRHTTAEIYFARLDTSGNRIGTEMRWTNEAAESQRPALVWNGVGFASVWVDSRTSPGSLFSSRLGCECQDGDADSVCNDFDDCPYDFEPLQLDSDGDGLGDACDPDACASDAFESDNILSHSPAITHGQQQGRNFCSDGVDRASFAAVAGAVYTITATALGTRADTILWLLDTDGSTLLASNDDSGGPGSRITWTAPSDGVRHLEVISKNWRLGPGTSYSLQVLGPTSVGHLFAQHTVDAEPGEALAVVSLPDGGAAVAGRLTGVPTDGWIARYTASGALAWRHRISPYSGGGEFRSVDLTTDGQLLVGGLGHLIPPTTGEVGWVRRIRLDGSESRVKDSIFQAEFDSRIDVVRADGLERSLLGGSSTDFLGTRYAQLLSVDRFGYPIWKLTFSIDPSSFSDLTRTSTGVIAAGYRVNSGGAGDHDGLLVGVSDTGLVSWQISVGGGSEDEFTAVAPRPGGGVVAAGYTRSFPGAGSPSDDAWLAAFDSAGGLLWSRIVRGVYDERFSDVLVEPSGAIAAVGWTNSHNGSPNPSANDILFVKFDASGNVMLQETIGSAPDEKGRALALTADGGYFLAGSRGSDIALVRANANGEVSAACGLAVSRSFPIAGPSTTVTPLSMSPGAEGWWYFTDIFSDGSTLTSVIDCSLNRPTEVSPPGSPTPLIFIDKTTLTWAPAAESASSTFNLRRDPLSYLAAGDPGYCLWSGLTTNWVMDQAVPAPGTGEFYLVSGSNAAGEGTLGNASSGAIRPIAPSCP